jgi:DNA-binding NtrC family response regulator
MGYEAISAENGSRGIELYLKRREDVRIVILDMIMPNMGGVECLAKLRGINPELKVIVASGFSGDGGLSVIKDDPNCAFISKPYSIDELNALIIKMIGQRE